MQTSTTRATIGNTAQLAWLSAASLILMSILLLGQQSARAADIVVYKSPSCGCCSAWIEHLERNGFSVESHNRHDMSVVKGNLGVPRSLQSCHTAQVGGYLIEGHVPAEQIVRLLKEKPAVKGLAVPGMPMGSPGMEGQWRDQYDVISFDESGKTNVYSQENR